MMIRTQTTTDLSIYFQILKEYLRNNLQQIDELYKETQTFVFLTIWLS